MTLRIFREWQRPPIGRSARLLRWTAEAVRQGGLPALALFIFHLIAACGFAAYVHFPLLDIPMHFLGGVVIAFFFHRAAIAASRYGIIGTFHGVTHMVLVFGLVCAATVFWEFAEFFADRLLGTHTQLGLDDTLGDLLVGICGGSAFLSSPRRFRALKLCHTKQPCNPT